jgi:hypothetical protein
VSQTEITDSGPDEDALDRRFALQSAIQVWGDGILHHDANAVLNVATAYYEWLRQRNSLMITLSIQAGQPTEGA